MDRQHQGTTDIEVLEEILGLLRITDEYVSDKNITIELTILEDMSIVSVSVVLEQAVMPKSMVLDLRWFDGDQIKFKD